MSDNKKYLWDIYNMSGRPYRFNEERAQEIIQKAKTGMTREALGREYGCKAQTIQRLLERYHAPYVNMDRDFSVPSCNQHYFDKIDTANKAYFLGFLFADGCNVMEKYEVTLHLQSCDRPILEAFKKEINSTLEIKRQSKILPNGETHYYDILKICGKYLCTRLNGLGMTPRKSATIAFPKEGEVPHAFFRDFLRGYVDGNGSLGWDHARRKYEVSITSSKIFCQQYHDYILKELGINCRFYEYKSRGDKPYEDCVISRKVESFKLMDYLYGNSELYLQRKYEKYLIAYNEMNDTKIA